MELIHKSTVVEDIRKLINEIYAGRPFDSLSREQQVALWYVKSIWSSVDALEVKEVNLEKEIDTIVDAIPCRREHIEFIAKHFFELGLKQKGE